jgi:hypothetical protein
MPFYVIPAKAGIQSFQYVLDTGLRRHDGVSTFYEAVINDLIYEELSAIELDKDGEYVFESKRKKGMPIYDAKKAL